MSSTYPIQAAVSKLPFDPIADMQPIIMVSRDPVVVLVNADSPLKNAQDLHGAAVRSPGKLTYGSAGVGSIAHLGMEELAHVMGISSRTCRTRDRRRPSPTCSAARST
jgi:tripartite-type tricarboxylate transporter receptor subunit TctC